MLYFKHRPILKRFQFDADSKVKPKHLINDTKIFSQTPDRKYKFRPTPSIHEENHRIIENFRNADINSTPLQGTA
jgi:hypothetical protein